MKVRKLSDDRTVSVHRNDGIRKRCACQRRAWATCAHPWHFSFKWKDKHHRFAVDAYAEKPIATRDDAKGEADRLRRLIRAGQFPPVAATTAAPITPADLTFADFTEKWRTGPRATEAETLQANDGAICARLGALIVDDRKLAEWPIGLLTEDVLERAFGQLQSLAGSTWNKYRDVVLMLQRWGVKKGYLTRPWMSDDTDVIIHKATAKRERRLVPDVLDKGKIKHPGEERRLLAKAGAWLQNLIVAALETGARRGELLSFTWGDVSLTRGVVTVRAENAKSGRSRQIPMSPRLRATLAMIDKDPAGRDHKVTAFVFGDSVGRQIKDPKKLWLKCCADADITDLHFHDLRHEAGSRMLEAGWPLHHVQAVLGHRDAKTTSTYLNATLQHLIDSMTRFGSGHALHELAHDANSERPAAVQATTTDAAHVVVN